ncbi:hypothetical protein AAFF_G00137640 [Aldrovandia affinis]|uniref:Uncharacterized protein n=1 Tax=Aldrovandia affinis TaxID=143900 RepID=A0AAD7TBV8_9TELE|nr:hypothetical protein AAFF_G00137640 [Aldrovandia affinis]
MAVYHLATRKFSGKTTRQNRAEGYLHNETRAINPVNCVVLRRGLLARPGVTRTHDTCSSGSLAWAKRNRPGPRPGALCYRRLARTLGSLNSGLAVAIRGSAHLSFTEHKR